MQNSDENTNNQTTDLAEPAEMDLAVTEESETLSQPPAMSTLELESMITRNLEEVEKLKAQLKTQKEMYDSTFENDAAFAEQSEKEKELKKAVSAVKQKLVKQPAVVDVSSRMKDIKEEIKDIQDTISGLAEQYEKVSGNNQILKENGDVLEIVKTYKLVKKTV